MATFRKRRRWLWMILLIAVAAGYWWRRELAAPAVKEGSFLLVDLEGAYAEQPPSDLLGRLVRAGTRPLIDVIEALHKAAADRRVAGAIVRVGALDIGWAKTEDLRAALAAFKAAGKPVYAVLEQEVAAANQEYFLASVADRLYVAPGATVPLVGLAAQYLFLGGVWEKLDIEMHVEKIREYKTAGDMVAGKTMSPHHREMANSLLDSVEGRFVQAIAEGRRIEAAAVRSAIQAGVTTGSDLQASGLCDGAKYVSEVREQDAAGAPVVELDDYKRVDPASVGLKPAHTLAVVYGVGAVVTGEAGDSAVQGPMMGAATVGKALREAADNAEAKAIVFRVDSPGGSALASDLIWQATQSARKQKPVVVSMSDLAASGGYYVAAGATRILAQPTTLTGSIGVVFVRPTIRGMLGRLGISSETITRGRYAAINDLTTPLDEDLRQKLVAEMEHIYGQFVDRVARGRTLSAERVNEIGRGRVWTGAQAMDLGLVDEIGGFAAAIRAAKLAAGIAETDEVRLVYYPRRKSFAERLAEVLATRVLALDGRLPFARQLRAAMALYPFTEPGVLALMPEVVLVR